MKAEFWKLKHLDRLYQIYPEIEHSLPSFLKLHSALKKEGMRPDNVEWFANAMETGAVKLPELQNQVPKPSKQGSDCSLPKTKVEKRFAGYPKPNDRTD